MDEELQEMIAGFVEDCREGFESMEDDLIAMEDDPENPSIMNNLFRVMHTLKGTAGFMGLNEIQSFAHKMESVFDLVRQEKMHLTPKLLDFLLPAIDKLKAMVFGQVGECEIPDGTQDIAILERIIETCSDAVLSDDGDLVEPSSTPKEAPPQEAIEPPKESVEPPPASEDGIDFDAILAEHGAAVPTPETTKQTEVVEEPQETSEEEIDFDAIMAEHGANVPVPQQDAPPEPPSAPSPPISAPEPDIPPAPNGPPEGASPELLQQFVVEAEEHLETIEESLLALEEDPHGKEPIAAFFRAVHSIKGTAGYVNLKHIEILSHRIENIFDNLRKETLTYTKEIGDVVFKSIDMLRTMVFYIKIEDYSQSVDIKDQVRHLESIAAGEKPAVSLPETKKSSGADQDKLATFLAGAQQQVELLKLYGEEMLQGPLNEHDLITLHRSLKTLNAGAKYCELLSLEKAISDYEEMLLKILGGEIEQTTALIIDSLKPLNQKIIDEIYELRGEPKAAEQPKPEPTPPPQAVAKPPAMESQTAPPPPPEPVFQSEPEPEPPPPLETAPVPAPAPQPAGPPVVSAKAKAQQRAARQITNKPVGQQEAEGKSSAPAESKTMRVDASRLDRFMNLIGELIIARNAFKHLADTMDESRSIADIIQDVRQIENNISRISDNLQDNLMEMRLVQVKTVFQRMPRIVRDISRKTNKKIALQMVGESTEVDKSIVEEIGDPLVHIIRNSCDHGIEAPDARKSAGKNEQGTIVLKAGHMGSFIAIDIIDDGGGINPTKVKTVAVKRGVISQEESDQLNDEQAVNLIFAPGFSTAETVSDISGRGVGMDVVMTNIRNIQGTVDVTSELGKGTQVRLKLPLTLAVIEALVVGVNGTQYAVPLDAIKETVQISATAVKTLKEKSALELRGEILGVTPLTELLDLTTTYEYDEDEEEDDGSNDKKMAIVVLSVNDREIGIAVDRLYNQQEIVVKPLEDYLASIPGLKGSTIMGDGQVVLILEPNELMELATSA